MQELTWTAKLGLCREQENPSLWKLVPPHRDGQTAESNYKNGCLQTHPSCTPQARALSWIPGTQGKKREFRTFSYPEKNQDFFPPRWGEGVGSPVSHPGSQEGYSSLTEQAQKETPAPSQTPPPTCEQGRNAGEGSQSPRGCRIGESFSCCSCALVSPGLGGRHRHDRQTCTHCPRA